MLKAKEPLSPNCLDPRPIQKVMEDYGTLRKTLSMFQLIQRVCVPKLHMETSVVQKVEPCYKHIVIKSERVMPIGMYSYRL